MSDTRPADRVSADDLAFAVDAAVIAVAGVARLFPADPAGLRALQQVAGDGVPRAASAVRGEAVTVNVAVDDARPTREVLDDILGAVRAVATTGSVEIRVSRIQSASGPLSGGELRAG